MMGTKRKGLMNFVHLHCHSVFSFHAGVNTIKEMVGKAKKLRMSALTLTDTDNMSGLIRFYLACKEQGIKPILGTELTDPDDSKKNIVLLAKNDKGYQDICEIITKKHLNKKSFSLKDILARPWSNLFFITSFPALLKMVAHTPNQNNLFAELINNSKVTRQRSKQVEGLAAKLKIPLVISNNTFFLAPNDWKIHKILRAIGLLTTVSRLKPHEYAPKGAYLCSAKDLKKRFPGHRGAMQNTMRIADQCNIHLSLGEWIMPKIKVPDGYSPQSYLSKLAQEGLLKNYGSGKDFSKAKEIQKMELSVISRLGYSSYFLMVKQIRDWANHRLKSEYRRPKDCSILRGSAANSITFFNIAVSDLDPIKYDLYFQRFLNEDRASPPDADLDFGWDERDLVLDYMEETWGRDRVAIVCTTNHFRFRAAFRETAKVFGYTEEQVSAILKSRTSLSKKIEDAEIFHLLQIAKRIQGKPRFLGQHPGGVLVTNDPIWRHVACQYSGGIKNRIITQIDMHNGTDELGLIKFDILGNGSLSVLRDTLRQIQDQKLPDPQVWDLEKCFSDQNVNNVIKKGRTKGIFYIESPAQMRLNKKVGAESFEEITLTSSLVRPAGAPYIKLFVERHRKKKQGIKDWDFIHPSLETILSESYDVCAFQEDVTKICHKIAGLSYKNADRIRKMMNSLHEGILTSNDYLDTANMFMKGCINHSGLTKSQARELWKRVSSFTGFSFCKSHSASYAQLSFKCTYLKTYYPAQFFAAVISNRHGFYTVDAYLGEARRWGIRILPVDINQSCKEFKGKDDWVRPGFMHIRNLSFKSMEDILAQRKKGGPFLSLIDFIKRTNVFLKEVENLILVGAFDTFGTSRPQLLFILDGIYGQSNSNKPLLFERKVLEKLHQKDYYLSDYSLMEKCLQERHLLGYIISADLLEIFHLHPASKDAVLAKSLPNFKGRQIKVFGRQVTQRGHVVQKSGKHMLFLTLEDKTGCIDVIFWPGKYEAFFDIIHQEGPFEIWGTVTEDWDTFTLEATYIRKADWAANLPDFKRAEALLKDSLKKKDSYHDVYIKVAV